MVESIGCFFHRRCGNSEGVPSHPIRPTAVSAGTRKFWPSTRRSQAKLSLEITRIFHRPAPVISSQSTKLPGLSIISNQPNSNGPQRERISSMLPTAVIQRSSFQRQASIEQGKIKKRIFNFVLRRRDVRSHTDNGRIIQAKRKLNHSICCPLFGSFASSHRQPNATIGSIQCTAVRTV
ncbi:AAEL000675-PA [Aedes aegypti]|uniref:AAEL000675-PA n=1 Tax=Aedes aegypti TaxID=7159 RepID=Q16W65_AEDAE|nr:AAEL009322-PA [Aedes aegypti]EAT48316.1 AAEL000675-PA [Aedes aegypti]